MSNSNHRRMYLSPGQPDEIVHLYRGGMAVNRLVKMFGCGNDRIVQILQERDITIRGRGEAALCRNVNDDYGCYLPTLAEIEAAKRELLERDLQRKRESDPEHAPDRQPRVYTFNSRSGYTPGSI